MEWSLRDLVIRTLYAVNGIDSKTSWQYRRQDRPQCAFALKLSGHSIYRAAGQAYLSDAAHVVFLPKGMNYALEVTEPGRCVMVEFDCEGTPPPIGSFVAGTREEVAMLAEALLRAWTSQRPGFRHRCMALLYDWMARVERGEAVYTNSVQQHKLLPAVEYMHAAYADGPISNERLAARVAMSSVYFRKLFSKAYGVPPQTYLLRLRMRKAKELLMSDYASVGDVARAVGFESIYHFDRVFHREEGMTPTEYARIHVSTS